MKKVSIDDFAHIRKLSDLTVSPSGHKAALAVSEGADDNNSYRTDIYVYDPSRSPSLFRLTAMDDGRTPVFEDEDTIIFPAKRNEKSGDLPDTVYRRISLNGGEAVTAFTLPFAASSLYPLGDGRFLCKGLRDLRRPEISTMNEEEKKSYAEFLKEETDYEVFDELPFWFNGRGVINKKRNGLYLYDEKTDTCTLLSGNYFDLHGFDVNDDHTKAVFWGNTFEHLNTQKSSLYVLDLDTKDLKSVIPEETYRVDFAVFSGEHIIFAATDGKKYGSSENPVFFITGDSGFEVLNHADPSLSAVGSDIAGGGSSIAGKDGLYFLQTIGYRSVYRHLAADGTITTIADDINIISCAKGTGPIYMTGMEKDRPQELYVKENGVCRKISAFNEEYVSTHEIAETAHFTFTDTDGIEIDGWILYPADFDSQKTYPAILDVHGGPQAAYGEGFFHEMQYWAGLGYIVFFCNPRGSSGKGGAFADIYGDNYGVRDYNDLMEFTDEVLRRVPQIDPRRVAMTGGSYGGFMANWIIGHTDRFAAVASQRSISNYLSKCLTTDIGYYHNLSAIQADPWTNMEKMWKHSPLAYADKAVTPTLFIQSDEDYRCWMGDAVQMLQALLMHGVPARMCLFHGENHELSRSGKPVHRIRRLKEITDWFDHYLEREEKK